jgi:hypothetical protein
MHSSGVKFLHEWSALLLGLEGKPSDAAAPPSLPLYSSPFYASFDTILAGAYLPRVAHLRSEWRPP